MSKFVYIVRSNHGFYFSMPIEEYKEIFETSGAVLMEFGYGAKWIYSNYSLLILEQKLNFLEIPYVICNSNLNPKVYIEKELEDDFYLIQMPIPAEFLNKMRHVGYAFTRSKKHIKIHLFNFYIFYDLCNEYQFEIRFL